MISMHYISIEYMSWTKYEYDKAHKKKSVVGLVQQVGHKICHKKDNVKRVFIQF